MSASTTVLPPPTCTARREVGQHLRLLFCCEAGQLLAVVSSRPVPVGLSAGCVRLQQPCSAGCACLPPLPCHAHCPHQRSCPRSFCFAPTCSFPCAPGSSQEVVRTVLLAATTRACSGGPCAGFDSDFLFPAESMILGHG